MKSHCILLLLFFTILFTLASAVPSAPCFTGKYDKYGKCVEEEPKTYPQTKCCPCDILAPPTPCHLVCTDGYVLLNINFTGVAAYGELADYQGYAGANNLSASLTFLFKPDYVRSEQIKKPKLFYLVEKGYYCLQVYNDTGNQTLLFSTKGTVKDGADITASLTSKPAASPGIPFDTVEIQIQDEVDQIVVDLKRNALGFGGLQDVLTPSIPLNTTYTLFSDFTANLGGIKNKKVVFHAIKGTSNITLQRCPQKSLPMVCPGCNGTDCPNITKMQAYIRSPKTIVKYKALVVKLDAFWRTCFNRTNLGKSEDFLISLLSIRECTSKDQSRCPRQVLDFRQMRITEGPLNGIPTASAPSVVFEGNVTVAGTVKQFAYLKVNISLINDTLHLSFQLNRNESFWKWVPQSKYSMMIFTFKVAGQMAVYMVPKSMEKSDIKIVQFEIRDNIRLALKPGYSTPFVIKTRLNLQFPMLINTQFISIDKKLIQNGRATLISLGFSPYHFTNGVLNYTEIVGNLDWQQFTPYAAEADAKNKAHLQVGFDDSYDEEEEQESSPSEQQQQQQSSAIALRNWAALI